MDPRSPRLDFDLVADRRARVVRATMVPAAVVMTTMGAFYASLGLWDLVVSYGLAICGALLALGLAHRGQVASAAQVGATAALSATLVDTLATGGLEGPGAAYLGLPPLIAAAQEIESMGGSVQLEGGGSSHRFRIWIPLAPRGEEEPRPPRARMDVAPPSRGVVASTPYEARPAAGRRSPG